MTPELCPDCQTYPPNLVKERLWSNQRGEFFGVECRDCGDYWEEFPAEDYFFDSNQGKDYFFGTRDEIDPPK